MTNNKYPGISDRLKALCTDNILLFCLAGLTTIIFHISNLKTENSTKIAFLLIFVLYDPLLTSFWGGTLGHRMFGIRVKRKSNENKNILLPMAIVRFIVKSTMGIFSLFFVHTNEKRLALHDMDVFSVVVFAKPMDDN